MVKPSPATSFTSPLCCEPSLTALPGRRPPPPPAATVPTSAGLRPVRTLVLAQLTPNVPATDVPRFTLVDPQELLVDESYQRGLSNRSIKLIRRMVGGWDWRKYKPPVVARTSAGLEVLDGQHTAIGAASHPLIDKIPVMIVVADHQAERAAAFVGHNKERLNLTPMQMHAAAAAAGDVDARAINRACAEAGVVVLKSPRYDGFRTGETIAVGAIGALVKRRDHDAAVKVLGILVAAGCAPVGANWIKAVDLLLHGPEYAGVLEANDLAALIAGSGGDLEKEAALFSGAHGVVTWKAMAVVSFRKCRKRRRQAS